ncbi:MAG: hypothetical protein IJF62_05420 [Firmicutes bacterium]|nr:hypothetical protein [Bacillota bacterium]MBQ3111515.1 hypothetical protein [Bacillota bacterium]MBQ6842407.1 hypothetical protein [Bacillota bacterium]MBR6823445.1 hypothetical protein [Bacillota bacterium]
MDAYLRTLPAEEFIYTALNMLKDDVALSDKTLVLLCTDEYCAEKFGLPCSVLKPVPFTGEIAEEEYLDDNGNRMYYPHPQLYKVRQYRFLVCCHMEGKQEAFIEWMHTI